MQASGALILLGLLLGSTASAVTQGQQDDFSVNTQGWLRGAQALGGPGGASDGYLRLVADGSGPNGRLVTFNQSQWSGDYLAAEVEAISLFLRNSGPQDVQIRLTLGTAAGGPNAGGTWYVTDSVAVLPSGSGWSQVLFPLGSGEMTLVQGSQSHSDVMQGVVTLRLLHTTTPSAFGDDVVATVGVDRVLALPEPGAAASLAGALAALGGCARRRARTRRGRAR
jgi:hypothetical protein